LLSPNTLFRQNTGEYPESSMMQTQPFLAVVLPLLAATAIPAQFDGGEPAARPSDGPSASRADSTEGTALPANVTFTGHVAWIIFNNCTSCHRPGEGAPFPLETYKQVRRKAKMIAKVTKSRIMPPWHPVKGHGKFEGEMRLTNEQIALIQKWVKTGSKEGNKRLPKMPKFVKGWQLGKPDMIVKMPKGFTVPAGGPDIYRNFVVPMKIKKNRWLTAIEVRPSARTVLHHIIFQIDTTGEARRQDGRDGRPGFRGMRSSGRSRGGGAGTSVSGLGGWAVGGQPRHLPMGLAREIPKGSDIILRSHFHPSGKKEVERTTLGLYFTSKAPTRTMIKLQLPPFFGIAAGLNIPAGKQDFKLKDSFTLTADALALTVGGHAHYICKEMHIWATFPGDQKRTSIFWIDNWAFNWQNRYQYKKPLLLPKGTRIDAEITYDNSANNPSNPHDPPRRVRWGQQSTDEMGSVSLLMVAKKERDQRRLRQDIRNASMDSMANQFSRGSGGITGLLVSRIRRMDKDGDGKVSKAEISRRYKPLVDQYDKDKDGALNEEEMEALAKDQMSRFRRR
jgi:hypothetical protein